MLWHAKQKYDVQLRSKAEKAGVPVSFALSDAEHLCNSSQPAEGVSEPDPGHNRSGFGSEGQTFPAQSFDTIIDTFGLCSHADPEAALQVAQIYLELSQSPLTAWLAHNIGSSPPSPPNPLLPQLKPLAHVWAHDIGTRIACLICICYKGMPEAAEDTPVCQGFVIGATVALARNKGWRIVGQVIHVASRLSKVPHHLWPSPRFCCTH